jgi:hypothetical protein
VSLETEELMCTSEAGDVDNEAMNYLKEVKCSVKSRKIEDHEAFLYILWENIIYAIYFCTTNSANLPVIMWSNEGKRRVVPVLNKLSTMLWIRMANACIDPHYLDLDISWM